MNLDHFLILFLPVFVLCNRSPVVEIEQGKLRGIVKTDWKGGRFYSFLSVPYAKPPLGGLRFKDPQPAEKWSGILEATEDMTECLQFNAKREIVGKEDCLYMNIHTPQVATKNLKPVMVYIHGGGYTEGSGKYAMFGPEFLIPEGVVVVTIQYRLGLFGFLNFENPKVGIPGNAGLKDQNIALKWVRKNIEMFGGDPKSVTLFGESAGGASTHMHLLSPLSHGLIHKAISQSGTALNYWNAGKKNTWINAAEILNYPTDDELKVLEYLQSVPIDDIMEVQKNASLLIPIDEYSLTGPVVEAPHNGENFLPQSPEALISKRKFTKIPFMIGYNDEETLLLYTMDMLNRGELQTLPPRLFIPHVLNVKDDETRDQIFEKIKKYYNIKDYKAGTSEYTKLASNIYIDYGVYLTAKEHSKINHKDLYLYKFSADTTLNVFKRMHEFTAKMQGATHQDELGYLFKTKFTPENLTQDSVEGQNIQRMVKLWTNFAKYGKPTIKEAELNVKWESVKKDVMNYLDITTESLNSKVDPFGDAMDFWDTLLGKKSKIEHNEL